ncbi:MAG: 4-hydroxy-tetrahydrodipicolinate reductase [Ruminococcaceae bacterium]|nr:4-hydroxy-tetrahydrodipicolinate reductase [Oscillospiraceae bacterium]
MKRILLSGCNGKMGRMITACVRERNDCTIVAGIDISGTVLDAYPVFTSLAECSVESDVIIDFSHPSALGPLLEYAVSAHVPAVIATTGLSAAQIALIHEKSKEVPLFFTFNMSLGVNLLAQLAKKAASVLGDQFDIEIIEKHHNQKIDAPSGTALMLADAVSSALANEPQYIYDRHAIRKKRSKDEIGIHSVRGGTIVGEHEVIFAGRDEVITLSHSAASKEVFAVGSINAALFLCDQENGLYDMGNLV